jgi:hypothetical protein
MAWVWEIKHGARPQAAGKLAPGWHKESLARGTGACDGAALRLDCRQRQE